MIKIYVRANDLLLVESGKKSQMFWLYRPADQYNLIEMSVSLETYQSWKSNPKMILND